MKFINSIACRYYYTLKFVRLNDMIDTVGPRCSICKKTGHNRRTCQVMEDGYHEVNYPLTRYEGEFKDGKKYGQGVITFPDYNVSFFRKELRYEGVFKDDRYNGQGVLTYSDGRRYEGEFKDNRYNGQGVLTYSNGHRYEGEFKDDVIRSGVFTSLEGVRYEGEFNSISNISRFCI